MTKMMSGRLLAPSLVLCAAASQAQTDATPPSPAQSLICLQRPAEPPRYPAQDRFDRASGFIRVQLKFDAPDKPPVIEVLANTAREDMQDRTFKYLRQYRLPCLEARDGTVTAVQEFRFDNSDAQRLPVPDDGPPGARLPFCIVMPRKDIDPPRNLDGRVVEHVVVSAVFSGDGEQPPDVRFLYSSAQPGVEKMVRERVQQYRMPCRNGTERPQAMQQQFSFRPASVSAYTFTRQRFKLLEFLTMVEDRKNMQADFDLNTMGCPFKVNYTIYGPKLPNEVHAGGPRDPNKLLFLRWLSKQQLAFANGQQSNDLFGSTLQIDVPCGVLKLPYVAAEETSAAS